MEINYLYFVYGIAVVAVFFTAIFMIADWIERSNIEEASHEVEKVKTGKEDPSFFIDEETKKKIEQNAKKASVKEEEAKRKRRLEKEKLESILSALEKSKDPSASLQKEIIKKLANVPEYIKKDGQEIMVVPLEALGFLNGYLNPLVNEHGEVLIKMKEDPVIEDIKKIMIKLKESGETLYQSDEELIQAVKAVILISRKMNVPVEQAAKAMEDVLSEKKIHQKKEEKRREESGAEGEENALTDKTAVLPEKERHTDGQPKEIGQKKESDRPKADLTVPEDLLDDEDIASAESSLKDIEVLDEDTLSLKDLIEMENEKKSDTMEDLEKEPEEGSEKEYSVYEMVAKKSWKEVEGAASVKMNKGAVAKSVESIVSKGMAEMANNVVKQAPIVFDDHKTKGFVDVKILLVAFARLAGVDYDPILKKLSRMPKHVMKEMHRGLLEAFSDYLDEKRFTRQVFTTNDSCKYGYGLWLDAEFFKKGFDTEEEFDFYRSFPPNEGLTPSREKEAQCPSPIIESFYGTEIRKDR